MTPVTAWQYISCQIVNMNLELKDERTWLGKMIGLLKKAMGIFLVMAIVWLVSGIFIAIGALVEAHSITSRLEGFSVGMRF